MYKDIQGVWYYIYPFHNVNPLKITISTKINENVDIMVNVYALTPSPQSASH